MYFLNLGLPDQKSITRLEKVPSEKKNVVKLAFIIHTVLFLLQCLKI